MVSLFGVFKGFAQLIISDDRLAFANLFVLLIYSFNICIGNNIGSFQLLLKM